ncbi:MAG: hypothetical protein M3033_14615 [Acidobacteriota bacterium]|nr:hypothetical protein [Acidobacteriota bacterium]
MSKLLLGVICGIVFGIISVLAMIPLQFEDKTSAMSASFISRFSIGFVIGATNLSLPGWASGLIIGLLISLPDAIITKTFLPILIMGAIGGVVIGLIVGEWSY